MFHWFLFIFINLYCGANISAKEYQSFDDNSQLDENSDDSGIEIITPTKINESFDLVLAELWPYIVKNGLDKADLPDLVEGFSYKPLFINYNAGVVLKNGKLWNVRKLSRYGDAYMLIDKKVFKFFGDVTVGAVEFSYDFRASVMGIGTDGTVVGRVINTILSAEFSLNLNDTNLILDNLQIMSFGDIGVQLKSNVVVRWVSEPFLRTITRLFQTRILTTVSDNIKQYVQDLLNDINDNDRLHIKQYVHRFFGIVH